MYVHQIGQGMDEDPRLKVFKREWFQGKDCLDIGCNSGIITIQIGNLFIFSTCNFFFSFLIPGLLFLHLFCAC